MGGGGNSGLGVQSLVDMRVSCPPSQRFLGGSHPAHILAFRGASVRQVVRGLRGRCRLL